MPKTAYDYAVALARLQDLQVVPSEDQSAYVQAMSSEEHWKRFEAIGRACDRLADKLKQIQIEKK